jgi:predicted transposase/invertase (TIGR01784 family)
VEAMTPVFQRFYEECQITKFTDMDKRNYVRNVLEFEDVKEMMECEREIAEQAGFERGMEKGMEQGIEKGREEGREEALLQTAKNFLAKGISVDDVSEATGLSIDRVRALLGC